MRTVYFVLDIILSLMACYNNPVNNTVLTNFILNHDGGIFVCNKFKDIFLMKIS